MRTGIRALATLTLVMTLLTGMGVFAGDADACEPVVYYPIRARHLADPSMNQPDSLLANDMRHPNWVDTSVPQIRGVYVVETVRTLEPSGAWTRGSVSVVAEVWGIWPDNTGPFLAPTENTEDDFTNSCGEHDGPELGSREYFLWTDQGDIHTRVLISRQPTRRSQTSTRSLEPRTECRETR